MPRAHSGRPCSAAIYKRACRLCGRTPQRARAGWPEGRPQTLWGLAALHLKLGQYADGLDCIAQAMQIVEATDDRLEIFCHTSRAGRSVLASGNQAAAEQNYQLALTVARRQSAKLSELRAAMSMARLWRDQGKREEARELLAPVYGWFTEGFDTRDLKDAKALLNELAALKRVGANFRLAEEAQARRAAALQF